MTPLNMAQRSSTTLRTCVKVLKSMDGIGVGENFLKMTKLIGATLLISLDISLAISQI